MLCLRHPKAAEEKEPLIVDLRQIIVDRVWDAFKQSYGPLTRRCLKRKQYEIEVPENYFVFQKRDQFLRSEEMPELHTNLGMSRPPQPPQSGKLQGQLPSRRDLTNPELLTLDTEFNNDTDHTQTYTFRFEKTRKTEINVSFQKGYTIGGKANFSIGAPKVLADGNLGLETEMQYQVTKSGGEMFEESVLMEATSNIVVGKRGCYVANVQLEERTVFASFQVIMRMSMPQGHAPVYIRRKSDKLLVFVYKIKNMLDMFSEKAVPCRRVVTADSGKKYFDRMDLVVNGVVKGMLACNHKIHLSSKKTAREPSQAVGGVEADSAEGE